MRINGKNERKEEEVSAQRRKNRALGKGQTGIADKKTISTHPATTQRGQITILFALFPT